MGSCWEDGLGFPGRVYKARWGRVSGALQAQCGWETEARWAGRGRFTFFSSPASWEGQHFIGLQSTGSWTSLWALAVTTVSKTRYCNHGSQGEGRALGS